ncbi:MAG: DUF1730 domain-containing protein [Clostridia bacterium]
MSDKNKNTIKSIIFAEGITEVGFLKFSQADIINERPFALQKEIKTIIVFLLPYRTNFIIKDSFSMSLYARIYDYHKRYNELFDSIIKKLNSEFPQNQFVGAADSSPINEKTSAAKCGLGIIGCNSLLINKKYGSFVFIGSIFTDMEILCKDNPMPESCIKCKKCIKLCPNNAITENGIDYQKCLSYLSQKKQRTEDDFELLKKNNVIWGCDICQNVCPMNQDKEFTNDPYFKNSVISEISLEFLESMTDEEFKKYPFSWRKKDVIINNVKNCIKKID